MSKPSLDEKIAALKGKRNKVKTSVSLSEKEFLIFQKLCKNAGVTPSAIIDIFIADFIEKQSVGTKK